MVLRMFSPGVVTAMSSRGNLSTTVVADAGGGCLRAFGRHVGAHHVSAKRCQRLRGGFADARGRAQHDGGLASEIEKLAKVRHQKALLRAKAIIIPRGPIATAQNLIADLALLAPLTSASPNQKRPWTTIIVARTISYTNISIEFASKHARTHN